MRILLEAKLNTSACTKSTPSRRCATPHTSKLKNFLTLFCTGWWRSEFCPPTSSHLSTSSSSPWNPEWSLMQMTPVYIPALQWPWNQTVLMSQCGFQILPLTTTSPTGTYLSWPSLWWWSSLGEFPAHLGHSGHTREDSGLSWGLWAPSGHHHGYLQKWPSLVCRIAEQLTSTLEQQTNAESFNPRSKKPPFITTAATKG